MATEKKLDCVILGLLSHESLTGYEIKKRLDTSLKYFWGASYGSIYPTLNQLEQNSFVSKCETKENGREKVIYTIKEEGRIHLKNWLSVPVVKDELRYETLLKLFFGAEVGEEDTLLHIERFEEKIKSELPILQFMLANLERVKEEEDAHLYYLLTVSFGEKVYRTYLEWCEEAKIMLHEKKKKQEEKS